VERDETAETGANQSHRAWRKRLERGLHLRDHPRGRQRLEIRFVEVWTLQFDAMRTEEVREERSLPRLRRRREPVKVEDVPQQDSPI
jgi:hypothetical protein